MVQSRSRLRGDEIMGAAQETMALRVTLADIETARRTIAGQVLRTPMLPAPKLSALTGADVFVKYENLQVTNSFKERGAVTKLASLKPEERTRGVIAMSAGNHAQAVAYHAARLGIPATIVMPETTPYVKVAATRAYGAEVVLDGEGISEAQARATVIAKEKTLTWVHPYDDPFVIAGQGTVALEMLEEVGDLDVLVIPIGGGGLIAGNAVAARGVKPTIEVIGAEAALYLHVERPARPQHAGRRRHAGRRHRREGRQPAHAADLPRARGRHRAGAPRPISNARECLPDAAKAMAEGAGAAGLAAMLAEPDRFRGRKVGLILCGGSIDPRILASIMVRELERDNRIMSFRPTIPDRPGVLGHIATRLGELGANILEVDHRRLFLDVPAKGARLDITVETRDRAHADAILAAFEQEGFEPLRIETGAAMD